MDILKAMGLFVRVVDKGSLTAAATENGLSPTMVGNHLRALEDAPPARPLNLLYLRDRRMSPKLELR